MSRARLLAARASPVAVAVAQAAKVAAACATVGVVAETVTAIAGNVTEAAQKVRRAAESVGTALLETEQALRAVVAVLVLVVIVCTDIYLWVAWVASRLADRVVSLSSPTAHSIPATRPFGEFHRLAVHGYIPLLPCGHETDASEQRSWRS
ncbi:uncharacterized protein [Aegilops tauschii subsp. strangulata]|uniref:uncharacterized protein n=1 Tax=Triticum aestivum TaxID=4565 RepID=UPI001D033A29|nr:uncharacterized protein LOC123125561 [Triticum aestivum]